MKVAVVTLGCKVNQAEANIIQGTLKDNGISIVKLKENPDYCIVNTCSVTAKSDYNSRQLIRRAAREGSKVIVTGCYSQLRPAEVRRIHGVEEIIDISRKNDIISLLTKKTAVPYHGNHSQSRPLIKIQDGCDFQCSYCVVPLARGKSRSIPYETILEQSKIIESLGYHEVVLTGIHLGTYGRDLREKTTLSSIVRRLLDDLTIDRIRLSSLEINEINDELIEIMQDKRICRHLHIPLQSGSSRILQLMRRTYSAEYFEERFKYIFSRIDNISIGTDVIVGFPGEHENEFRQTYELTRALPFSYIHVFPFSSRPGTEASKMKGKLSVKEIRCRMKSMIQLKEMKKKEYMIKQLQEPLDVILEDRVSKSTIMGTSGNYMKVSVVSETHAKGERVFVRADRIRNNLLEGNVMKCS
jgi:threonylcarbamoyladenosine tRNA methylthiotransferase MtaB